jgi:hypothetical protein
MASVAYGNGIKSLITGGTDIDTDTIKCALVTSTYTPDADTHDFFNDVTNEVTGTGYTGGGATLGSVTVTVDTANNRVVFDAADTSWATSTITARAAVIYKSTGTAGTSPLLFYIDFGSDITSTGGTFLITWSANGVMYFSY